MGLLLAVAATLIFSGTAMAEDAMASHNAGFSLATPDGRFSLRLYGYGQMRFTLTDRDGGTNQSNFAVQRARLGLTGNAFDPRLAYTLYLNVYSGKADADVALFDLYADYTPSGRPGIKVGQYKVPYGVQWNISAASLQFVERTTVDGNFRLDRDTGVSVHGLVRAGLRYDLGVFNGEGTNQSSPDTGHLWVARLMASPLGQYALAESDPGNSAEPRLLLALGGAFNDNVASHSRGNLDGRLTVLGKSDVTSLNAFAGFRWRGATAQVEMHHRRIDPVNSANVPETAVGLVAQGGFFIVPGRLELAARYEYFDPNRDASGDLVREGGLGIGRFWAGHRHKVQADLFRVSTQSAGVTAEDNRLRVQYQLRF
ncbi:MAG: porin [Leptospirillia bacterium]